MATIAEIRDRQDFELVQAQERAHDVFRACDLPGAPPPLPGEGVQSYRQRLASRLQHHSEAWKKTELSRLPSNVLSIAEQQIFADALRYGSNKLRGNPDGTLREYQVTDQSGRSWTQFGGPSPLPWMQDFMPPVKRLVGVKGVGHIPGHAAVTPDGKVVTLL
jgi:hypothetical protein